MKTNKYFVKVIILTFCYRNLGFATIIVGSIKHTL